jgi:hypothetical protein
MSDELREFTLYAAFRDRQSSRLDCGRLGVGLSGRTQG